MDVEAPALTAPVRDRARLFLALWPDEPARDVIAAWQATVDWPPGARRLPRAGWHVTLHFLGDVERGRLAPLAEALARVEWTPFTIAFDRLCAWHRGLVVLEPAATPPALAALHAALADAVAAPGLRVEARPLHPHLTIARRAPAARLRGEAPPRAAWPVTSHAMVESADGRYATLGEWDRRGQPIHGPPRPDLIARSPPWPPR